MFVYLFLLALGTFLLIYSAKRRREYRSFRMYQVLGIFVLSLPLLVFLMMVAAVIAGGQAPA